MQNCFTTDRDSPIPRRVETGMKNKSATTIPMATVVERRIVGRMITKKIIFGKSIPGN